MDPLAVLILVLFFAGLRFLIFDSSVTYTVRKWFFNRYQSSIIQKLLKCPFCQGFWLAFIPLFFIGSILSAFMTGIIVGFLSITWAVLVLPRFEEFEEDMEKHYETKE